MNQFAIWFGFTLTVVGPVIAQDVEAARAGTEMRVSIVAPWATEVLVSSSGGRKWRVGRIKGEARAADFALRLGSGFEYSFAAVAEEQLLRSRLMRSGPVVGNASVRVEAVPESYTSVPITIRGVAVDRVESYNNRLLDLPGTPWPLSATDYSLDSSKEPCNVLLSSTRETLLCCRSKMGPYYRLVHPRPTSWGVVLELPDLRTIEVVAKNGKPVPGAFVGLSPPRSLERVTVQTMNPQLTLGGITDARGRVAVPRHLLESCNVFVQARGYRSESVPPGTSKIVLQAVAQHGVVLKPARALAGAFHVRTSPDLGVLGVSYRNGTLWVHPDVRTVSVFSENGWFFYGAVEGKSELVLSRQELEFRTKPKALPATFTASASVSVSDSTGTDGYPVLYSALGVVSAGKGPRQSILAKLGVVMDSPSSCRLTYGVFQRRAAQRNVLVFEEQPGQQCSIRVVDSDGEAIANALVKYELLGVSRIARTRRPQGLPYPMTKGNSHSDEHGRCSFVAPTGGSIQFCVSAGGKADVLGSVGAGTDATVVLPTACWLLIKNPDDAVTLTFLGEGVWTRAYSTPRRPGNFGGQARLRYKSEAGEPLVFGPICPGKIRLQSTNFVQGIGKKVGQRFVELHEGELCVVDQVR